MSRMASLFSCQLISFGPFVRVVDSLIQILAIFRFALSECAYYRRVGRKPFTNPSVISRLRQNTQSCRSRLLRFASPFEKCSSICQASRRESRYQSPINLKEPAMTHSRQPTSLAAIVSTLLRALPIVSLAFASPAGAEVKAFPGSFQAQQMSVSGGTQYVR